MKTKLILLVVLSAIWIGLLSNCTLQKRRYTRGFYIAKKHQPLKKEPREKVRETPEPTTTLWIRKEVPIQSEGVAMAERSSFFLPVPEVSVLPPSFDTCNDRILFLNGEETQARVLEVTELYVRYKPCDNLEGPEIVYQRAKVFMISYSNGQKQVFDRKTTATVMAEHSYRAQPKTEYKKKRTVNAAALIGFILSLFSWTVILAPVSLTLGLVGTAQIKNHPDKYKGSGFAEAAVLISLIVILFVFLLIAM